MNVASTKEQVLAAVAQDGGALRHASAALRGDREFIAAMDAKAQAETAAVGEDSTITDDSDVEELPAVQAPTPDVIDLAASDTNDNGGESSDGSTHRAKRTRAPPRRRETCAHFPRRVLKCHDLHCPALPASARGASARTACAAPALPFKVL